MEKCPFVDIPVGTWQEQVAEFSYTHKLIRGVGNYQFNPNGSMTRAQFMVVLWRMAGQPKVNTANPFSDVKSGYFAEEAIKWAKANGITHGYADGTFRPNEPMKREQFYAFLQNYAKYRKLDTTTGGSSYLKCKDANKGTSVFENAIEWAYERGFVGATGELMPGNNITRIQACAALMRFMNYYHLDLIMKDISGRGA